MVAPPVSPHSPTALLAALDGAPSAARAALRLLQQLRHGLLELQAPGGQTLVFGQVGAAHELRARLELRNWSVTAAALRSGDIGFAETYIAGDWTTPDLVAVLRVMLANRQALEDVIHGSWAGRLLYRLRHLLRRNTRSGSRRNIHAHYDLGNAFYRLWLDDTMTYSSAWFEGDAGRDLASAQRAKIARTLRMAGVTPGARLLEIGCGWGTLAETAARDFGARVTGVTLSTEQLTHGLQRLAAAGLSDRVELRLQDYRDVADGPYDAIVSVEMIEAVGRAYWPTYFDTLQRLLRPGGHACIQAIVIQDALFERYVRSTDFIQQYIFPGGCLLSPAAFHEQAQRAGLQVVDTLAFGRDYAETCRRWRRDFLARREAVLALGFDDRFVRLWSFYLAYCEAGFDAGDIDVVQYTLVKP
ncbi:cyclopropane-fatty-acyl-phospholipid synthase family protein [Tepidimonas sp.]|uniref:cyclopropane-fatty-acyl-phospholipid synthase family protein n=1 Tax=Tepidimonas sp. TaxID=2002775 RepID=UPI002FE2B05B